MTALVLVVDDYDDTREMCAEYLLMAGFRVIQARSGEEALEKAFAHNPDAILMDVSLPGIDGTVATRRLKADERTARTPVIGVTGHPDNGKNAFDAHLLKPCAPEEMVATLRRLIGAKPAG